MVLPHLESKLPELEYKEGAPPCCCPVATDNLVVLVLGRCPLGGDQSLQQAVTSDDALILGS